MGSAESDHLNSILTSQDAYQQYYGFIHNLVDQQNIHAIQTTIDKIQETLKGTNKPPQSRLLAVQLARQLLTTGSYAYFILLSTRVLPLLVYSAEFKKEQPHVPPTQARLGGASSGVMLRRTETEEFIRMTLQTIMAIAIWLPISPYQCQNFPSLFRLEYERMVYDDQQFPEHFAIVRDHEPEKQFIKQRRCKQSYSLKIPRRLDYVQQLEVHVKKRFKEYLARGSPLQYRRLAMNILWTGDNHFCTYLVELCCKAISDPTATEFKRMNALDFLEDVFGVADVQCLEEIKAKAVPCMLEYIFPIDFKQNKYLQSPKFLNSNLRNRCVWLLAVWTKRMRQFPIINRSLYEIVYKKISSCKYNTDPIKLERQEEVTAIMEQNIKYRRAINDAKMNVYLIPPEIDICTNLIRGYQQPSASPSHLMFRQEETTIQRSSFVPNHQVMSLKPQSLPSVAVENYVPFTMTSSRVLMQHPQREERTSRVIHLSSDKSTKVVLPRPNQLGMVSPPPVKNSTSALVVRSQSAAPRVISSNMVSIAHGGTSALVRPQSPMSALQQYGGQPSIIERLSEDNSSSQRVRPPSPAQLPMLNNNIPFQLKQLQSLPPMQFPQTSQSPLQNPNSQPAYNPFVANPVPPPPPPFQSASNLNSSPRPPSHHSSVDRAASGSLSNQTSGKFAGGVVESAQSLPQYASPPPPNLYESFSPRANVSQQIIVASFGSEVNNSSNRRQQVFPQGAPPAQQNHQTSVQMVESQQYIKPVPMQQIPSPGVVQASNFPVVVVPRSEPFTSTNSNNPTSIINKYEQLSLESQAMLKAKAQNLQQTQADQGFEMRETLRGRFQVPQACEQEVIFDVDVNQEQPDESHSHFRLLESSRQLFNDTYEEQVKSLMSVSMVEDNPPPVEDEFVNDDISTINQTVQKGMFAFGGLNLKPSQPSTSVRRPPSQRQSTLDQKKQQLRSRPNAKVRPCTPLSMHMNKIKEALGSSQEMDQPAALYGLVNSNHYNTDINSQVRISYENKIKALEEQLKVRMQKEDEYEEQLGKLASTIRQNNVRSERRPPTTGHSAALNNNNQTLANKTQLKGYSLHRRLPSEELQRQSDSRVMVAAVSKPIAGWSQVGVKRLLIRQKDLLLTRSNLQVGYLWQSTADRVSMSLYYTFFGVPATDICTEFESPDVVVQHRPIISKLNVRPDEQIRQQVTMKLVRIENFCRPILHLSYRQGRDACKESIELPIALFRFVKHQPIDSEELTKGFANEQVIRYTKVIHSIDKQLTTGLEGLRELIPELSPVKTKSQELIGSSAFHSVYGCRATLNQQEVLLRLSTHINRSVTIDILPRKGSTKLASVYLESLSNLLRED